uniref:Uncharacterized protein n=1 Tax=Pipistrellus kuhlii TaxID=59472 RepID=A0A7J7TA76_PIPKU|nr:hypothetical protein mPipKuh1_009683 [Pipistrellus kuhlii]
MHMEPRRGCLGVSGSHRGDSASQKDFGPRCGKGLKKRHSLINSSVPPTTPCKQQPLPGSFAVTVRTTYPILRWLHGVSHTLKSGAAQTQAIMRWSVFLQQRHNPPFNASDRNGRRMGPVTFVSKGVAEKTLRESLLALRQ